VPAYGHGDYFHAARDHGNDPATRRLRFSVRRSPHPAIGELPGAGAAARAGLPPIWPNMLRHSCGFYVANRSHDLRLIQGYLGQRHPKHTVHYTKAAGICCYKD
jgi:Phage integrase family